MSLRSIIAFLFISIASLFITVNCEGQESAQESHLLVSLRLIGHELLLSSGDSLSRVLPITKANGTYRISFESDFGFNPDDLVATIDRVMEQAKLNSSYIVEMEDCTNGAIVYSYEADILERNDLVPCRTRIQPKSCYSLLFTLLDKNDGLVHQNNTSASWMSHYGFWLIGILVLIIFLIPIYKWKTRKDLDTQNNLIRLGDYQFDKRNTELLYANQRIELTSKEADLLLALYNEVNTTIKREVILNRVWGDEGDYVGRTLDVFISKLRKKLEADPKLKIVNIRGVGYKLVVDA